MKIKSIFFVVAPDGKIWRESSRVDHDDCRNSFVKDWMTPIEKYMDNHTCWQVWQCFQRAGYKIEEVELNLNPKD
jgi:hypothetical protein